MLGYSQDAACRPAAAADGCCYLVLELGELTLADAASMSAEGVRQTTRSLLAALAELHRCGLVFATLSARHFMRFGGEWKCYHFHSTPEYPRA